MRPRIIMRLLSALGLVVAWAGTCPAFAQQSTSSTAVFDDWSLRCQTSNASGVVSRVCEVNSTLAAKATDGRQVVVLVIAVGKSSPDKPNQVVVNAPTSVWLPVGVKLQNNGGKTLLELPYTTCKASMCAALMDAAETDVLASRRSTAPSCIRPIRWSASTAKSSAAPRSSARSFSNRTTNGPSSAPATLGWKASLRSAMITLLVCQASQPDHPG